MAEDEVVDRVNQLLMREIEQPLAEATERLRNDVLAGVGRLSERVAAVLSGEVELQDIDDELADSIAATSVDAMRDEIVGYVTPVLEELEGEQRKRFELAIFQALDAASHTCFQTALAGYEAGTGSRTA